MFLPIYIRGSLIYAITNPIKKMSLVEFELPGFRFHPTEEELINFYLKRIINDDKFESNIIGFLNIYLYDPWELPGLARIGEREWYFLVPINRKHGPKGKPNRTTRNGFWKATGSDRQIRSSLEPKKIIGVKKTLVFYGGRAPKGTRTDWVMNEYKLPHPHEDEDIVLCKVYRKAISFKVLEERAMVEEDAANSTYLPSPHDQSQDMLGSLESSKNDMYFKNCEEENPQLSGSNAFVELSKFSIDSLSSPLWSVGAGQDLWSLFSLS